MNYIVKWHPGAYKVLSKLRQEMIARIITKLDDVSIDPFRYLEHYEGEGLYKLRIGQYRALISVDNRNSLLLVKAFDHRKRVYKI